MPDTPDILELICALPPKAESEDSLEEFLQAHKESNKEGFYLSTLLGPLEESTRYDRTESTHIDVFSSWMGLDNDRIRKIKNDSGLLTSVYRQIGIGCERLVRCIVQDQLGLAEETLDWHYCTEANTQRSLDLCISRKDVTKRSVELNEWFNLIEKDTGMAFPTGAVFEIRQGYKSGDSKRLAGDQDNARKAIAEGYLPVLLVLSTQLSDNFRVKYKKDQWLILIGSVGGSSVISSYTFFREVIGYDLADLLERNQDRLKKVVNQCLTSI